MAAWVEKCLPLSLLLLVVVVVVVIGGGGGWVRRGVRGCGWESVQHGG